MDKSPAFQIYPKDFISDFDVQNMNMEEVGVYIYLLFADWLEGGIPDDRGVVEGWLKHRCTTLDSVAKPWAKFTILKNGKRYNPRLDKERQKQEIWRQKSSEGGKKGAASRRETKGGSGVVEDGSRVEVPKGNSSLAVSGLQSSPSITLPKKKKEVVTNVPTILSDLSYEFLKQQAENFPNESALKKDFDHCVKEGSKNLYLFQTINNWDVDTIGELLNWILLDNPFWRGNIRTLGGIRTRKGGKGAPMKFENALASMETPHNETPMEEYERQQREKEGSC